MQCQCYKNINHQNQRCPNKAQSGSFYCGWHKTCQVIFNQKEKQLSQIPKKIIHKKTPIKKMPLTKKSTSSQVIQLSDENYDIDWRQIAIPNIINNYSVYMIPKGTVIYSGVRVKFPDHTIGQIRYFATLNTALWYAFSSDYASGEYGKVLSFETTTNLILFDVTNKENFQMIRKKYQSQKSDQETEDKQGNPIITDKIPIAIDNQDVISYAFADGSVRYSHPDIDNLFTLWMCKNLGFDGWCITTMNKSSTKYAEWHDEFVICRPHDVLYRLPYEFRLKNFYIYLTYKGDIVKKFHPDHLAGKTFQGMNSIKNAQFPYKGNLNKVSDKFLFSDVNFD